MTVQTQPIAKKKDRSTTYLLLLASVIAVAGIAFAVGRLTAPASASAANANGRFNGAFARASGAPGGTGRGFGLTGGIEGTVQSIDGSTMTVKLTNGNTVTVDLGTGTTYQSTTSASQGQVTTGSTVLVTVDGSAQTGTGGTQPAAGASGAPGGFNRTFTAKDVILVTP